MVLATDQKGGMTNSLYRDILRKAWNLSWNNKKLWVFGFFAAFLQTSTVIEILIVPRRGLKNTPGVRLNSPKTPTRARLLSAPFPF